MSDELRKHYNRAIAITGFSCGILGLIWGFVMGRVLWN